jgi:tetratricopeptide (TPR) repeat protein
MIADHDWRGARASMNRALELAPGSTLALRAAGALAYNQNRLGDAIALFRRALEQDPLSAAAYHNLALVLDAAHRFDEAEAAYRNALELAPGRIVTRAYLSLTMLARSRGDDAVAEAEREPYALFRLWAVAIVHHALGHAAEAEAALRQLIDRFADVGAYQIAEVCAARADADSAFEWLEKAFAQNDPGLTEILCGPLFRPLHQDPRWSAWVKRIGFEE